MVLVDDFSAASDLSSLVFIRNRDITILLPYSVPSQAADIADALYAYFVPSLDIASHLLQTSAHGASPPDGYHPQEPLQRRNDGTSDV